jgi:hypothetical protein
MPQYVDIKERRPDDESWLGLPIVALRSNPCRAADCLDDPASARCLTLQMSCERTPCQSLDALISIDGTMRTIRLVPQRSIASFAR